MIDGRAGSLRPEAETAGGPVPSRDRCTECGERLAHRNGCVECAKCGYSPCG